MNKVYSYPQKIFKYTSLMAFLFGVISCSTSQSTAAVSGETDGIYYSPSKDGQVDYINNDQQAQDYDIQIGSPYFDANGNGAEDFYYDEPTPQDSQNNVNIYTEGSAVYVDSGASTDWGRYDGVDVIVNNWGWNSPWWGWNGMYGFNSWGWGMNWGWNNPYWGMNWGWNNPYWGWGGYGYNPYWGWNNPYWGWGGYHGYNPYWGGGYYGNTFYNRPIGVRPGTRPGNYITNRGMRNDNGRGRNSISGNGVRPVRNLGVRTNTMSDTRGNVRPTRQVRDNESIRNVNVGSDQIRTTRSQGNNTTNNLGVNSGIRNTQQNSGGIRPVRATRPADVRPNTPSRTQTNPNYNRGNSSIRPRSNGNISQPRNNSNMNSGGIRSSSPSRGSSGGFGGGSSGGRSSSGGGVRR